MSSLSINGQIINVQGVKELKDDLSIQEASKHTKNNGLDEIYFTVDSKNFLAYGDNLNLGELEKKQIANLTYDGKQANLVSYENEMNSVGEGLWKGALNGIKKTKDTIFNAVGGIINSIGPSSLAVAGGAIGLGVYTLIKTGTFNTTIGSGTVGVMSSALGTGTAAGISLSELLKNGTVSALKLVAVTGAIGLGISAVAGAIGGVSESLSNEKDLSTIASVTKDGNYSEVEPTSHGRYSSNSTFTKPKLSGLSGDVGTIISRQDFNF